MKPVPGHGKRQVWFGCSPRQALRLVAEEPSRPACTAQRRAVSGREGPRGAADWGGRVGGGRDSPHAGNVVSKTLRPSGVGCATPCRATRCARGLARGLACFLSRVFERNTPLKLSDLKVKQPQRLKSSHRETGKETGSSG